MVTLEFGGWGGEYTIGRLSPLEKENIRVLFDRFTADLFFYKYDLYLGDTREQFYDYSDVYQAWSVCQDFSIILKAEEDNDWHDLEFKGSDSNYTSINYPGAGDFVCSCASEKGSFFSVDIDIDSNEFDINKLEIHYDDLSSTWLSDSVVSRVTYDGVDLEMDFDVANTTGKCFDQKLIHISEDGIAYDGLELICDDLEKPKYNTIEHIEHDDLRVLIDYMELYHSDKLFDFQTPIVYHSPLLYDKFYKEEVDELWFDKKSIKEAFALNLADEIPQHIIEKVKMKNPEWLI